MIAGAEDRESVRFATSGGGVVGFCEAGKSADAAISESELWHGSANSRRHDCLKKTLVMCADILIFDLPIFARACGRVSIGGDPDKRPVNRL
ncbi:MAG TPA: hypothetical protein VKA03_01940 [Methylovirgula sp.]|nr:hypothetical protein [Methylovirgula sp.]